MNCPFRNRNEDEIDIPLDFAAGRLDASRAALFSRHAQTCNDCSVFLREQGQVWGALDEFSAPALTVNFTPGLWRKIDAAALSETWFTRFRDAMREGIWRPAIALAAAAAFMVTGFVYDHRASALTVSVAEAEQLQHTLEDLQLLQSLNASAAELAEPIL